ncbi:unnamed protein product [Symbiodinium necroappetens]|uniref:Uncharacterized protein n=1 Tax=Symbiodinium necroappetens TaxID=1628268 RepID=A0A812WGZ8_9DINO|nr:unnamed protein product [Symbiodinium necroappetens]
MQAKSAQNVKMVHVKAMMLKVAVKVEEQYMEECTALASANSALQDARDHCHSSAFTFLKHLEDKDNEIEELKFLIPDSIDATHRPRQPQITYYMQRQDEKQEPKQEPPHSQRSKSKRQNRKGKPWEPCFGANHKSLKHCAWGHGKLHDFGVCVDRKTPPRRQLVQGRASETAMPRILLRKKNGKDAWCATL